MIHAAAALAALAAAVTIQPASVPAKGDQTAIVHLDQAGMVHLAAESSGGTACALVDHLRGPFAESGVVGRANCALDLLLDAGDYQLRLSSAARGKGKVRLTAEPFHEVNNPLPRLTYQRGDTLTVHPGQQASYWLHLDSGGPVPLRIAGATAGEVELWRSGKWVEANNLSDQTVHLKAGVDIHVWTGQPTLEAGDYLLVVYGTNVLPVTAGNPLDTVEVSYGFPPAPDEHAATLSLSELGYAAFELPEKPQVVSMIRLGDSPVATQLELSVEEKGGALGTNEGNCGIAPKALDPQCVARAHGNGKHIAVITGAPGARLALSWGTATHGLVADGDYSDEVDALDFTVPADGAYRVATRDLHTDADAAPLGCMLETLAPDAPPTAIAYDFLGVSPEHPFARDFNFDGSSETVAFAITQTQAYRIATSGAHAQGCELFRFSGPDLSRVAGSEPGSKTCNLKPFLSEGRYVLRLFGGSSGIEKLVIAKGRNDPAPTPGKTACRFASVDLVRGVKYRVTLTRGGDVGARGLVLRPLPLDLTKPLPVHLEAGETAELPVSDSSALRVSGAGQASFTCSRGPVGLSAQGGGCDLPAGAGALVLSNSGDGPANLVVLHPRPVVAPPPLSAYSPHLEAPPEIAEGVARPFDFDRESSHSVLFTVKQAGLYDVTTDGLLATSCSIRTPIVASVAQDQGGGRGRNCLVSTYLRDGRYLLTVTTVGKSRGRGAIRVSRRSVHELASLRPDGETFVRVDANQLVKQRLTVKRTADYLLSTTALGGQLQCRLEDAHGWPIVAAPTPCNSARRLARGAYVWMQMPLTVESSRHTQLRRIVPQQILQGNKPHDVELDTPYEVLLSKKGEDTFRFSTEADLDVHIALSNAMQGRLFAVAADGSKKAIEIIPPDLAAPPSPPSDSAPPDDGAAAPMDEGAPPPAEGDEGPPPDMGEGDEGQPPAVPDEPAIAATPTAPPPARPQVPSGMKVHLPAGRYELTTQHSRGDVHIRYRLQLGVDVLAPGVKLVVNAPARIPLRVAHDGILRLATTGETDVRCRIFDGSGRLLRESSSNGDDWNCALAEPFHAGDYEVVIESETQVPGVTTVDVSMPAASPLGPLSDGAKLTVGAKAVAATLPAEAAGNLQEVFLRSSSRFSCALTAADGTVLHEETNVTTCGFLRAAGGQPARLDVWALNGSADIAASLQVRPLSERSGSTVPAGGAVLAMIPRAGRYSTSTGMLCLPAGEAGVLRPCGPEVSLAAGQVVFALLGHGDAKLPLDEQVQSIGAPSTEQRALTPQPYLTRLESSRGLQLVAVRSPLGEKAGPACQLSGGVSAVSDRACFAASGVTESSLLSLRSAGEDPIAAQVDLQAVPYPSSSTPLPLGRTELSLEGSVVRLAPPASTWRADLTLAPKAWAVEINGQGAASDLCRPSDALQACELEGTGGEIVVVSPDAPHLEALTQVLSAAPSAIALTSRFELRAGLPGSERLRISTAETERVIDIEGASRCQIRLDDGSHLDLCHATLPAHEGALLRLEHGSGAVRATVHGASDLDAVRFGALGNGAGAALAAATFVGLSGDWVERTIDLPHDAVLHLVSTGGVCALAQGQSLLAEGGLDAGCDLYRSVKVGRYRFIVRRFADAPLAGQADWNAVDVAELADGVGVERWLAPGERRFFHFHTASAGQVGVGMQASADVLDCSVYAADQTKVGDGCQELLSLPAGDYLLSVTAPAHGSALRFHPVVLGLTGAAMDVPEDYLRDFFARVGAQP